MGWKDGRFSEGGGMDGRMEGLVREVWIEEMDGLVREVWIEEMDGLVREEV